MIKIVNAEAKILNPLDYFVMTEKPAKCCV